MPIFQLKNIFGKMIPALLLGAIFLFSSTSLAHADSMHSNMHGAHHNTVSDIHTSPAANCLTHCIKQTQKHQQKSIVRILVSPLIPHAFEYHVQKNQTKQRTLTRPHYFQKYILHLAVQKRE